MAKAKPKAKKASKKSKPKAKKSTIKQKPAEVLPTPDPMVQGEGELN